MNLSNSYLKLATYNIHGCIGTDGEFSPGRISEVIKQLDADIIALQEVESYKDGSGQTLYDLETDPEFTTIHGPTLYRRDSSYGNAVLSRYQPVTVAKRDISQPGLEPRGVISLLYDFNGVTIQVLSTHLGLRTRERKSQFESIFHLLNHQPADIRILMGDINEWFPWGSTSRKLKRYFGRKNLPATFPSRFPLFSLDQVRVDPGDHLKSTRKHATPLSIVASDHLPLLAEIRL